MLMQVQVWGGLVLLLVIGFQLVTGMRKPGLFGKNRLKVHKWVGWAIAAAAVFHGAFGFWIAYF